jgi:hypothetical protein
VYHYLYLSSNFNVKDFPGGSQTTYTCPDCGGLNFLTTVHGVTNWNGSVVEITE